MDYDDSRNNLNPYPANTESDQPLAGQLEVLTLISLKMIMGSAKNVRWIIPFKKFGMVRVNEEPVIIKQ